MADPTSPGEPTKAETVESRAVERIRRLESAELDRIEHKVREEERRRSLVEGKKPSGGRHDRVARIEELTRFPLTVLGVVWLVLSIVVLTSSQHQGVSALFVGLLFGTWLIFLVEYVVRLFVTPDTKGYVRRRWAEPLTVLLPVLQGWHLYGVERVCLEIREFELRIETILKHHSLFRVLIAAVGTIFVGAWLVLLFESHVAGHNIKDYPDALWWAIVTVTTVGYGDKFPLSEGGRVVATVLMLVGIGLIGVLTATVASVFVKEHTDANKDEVRRSHDNIGQQLAVISGRLADIELRLGATPEQVAQLDETSIESEPDDSGADPPS
jgi:voltage-gated potassium channel